MRRLRVPRVLRRLLVRLQRAAAPVTDQDLPPDPVTDLEPLDRGIVIALRGFRG